MLTIQDVGTEILNNNPRKFYIFGGTEYGIKCKYIDIMKTHYGRFEERQNVSQILDSMSVYHFIPLEPTLYIVRYDEEFVSNASEQLAKKIDETNIIGTIVCIYESDKHVSKLAKQFPKYTVRIDPINQNFIVKYLKSDFPELSDRLIQLSAKYATDYNEAKNICKSMSSIDVNLWFNYTDKQIISMFGKHHTYSDSDIKLGVAAKNFKYLVNALECYDGEYDKVFYAILSTMIELEKCLCSKFANSDLKDYTKNWMETDIRHMYMNTYAEIKKLRTYATDAKSSLIYLFSMLNFDHIPSLEFMESE